MNLQTGQHTYVKLHVFTCVGRTPLPNRMWMFLRVLGRMVTYFIKITPYLGYITRFLLRYVITLWPISAIICKIIHTYFYARIQMNAGKIVTYFTIPDDFTCVDCALSLLQGWMPFTSFMQDGRELYCDSSISGTHNPGFHA